MATTINADNGVVSGSAGLKETPDASGILALQTNGVTALTLDASQNAVFAGTVTATDGVTGNASTATALTTASGSAPSYSARAWVNFNGKGTVAIRASGNVSSITDNGTGDYTVNFTTAMPDANYGIQTTGSPGSSNLAAACVRFGTAPTTSAVRVQVGIPGVGFEDQTVVCVSIFR